MQFIHGRATLAHDKQNALEELGFALKNLLKAKEIFEKLGKTTFTEICDQKIYKIRTFLKEI